MNFEIRILHLKKFIKDLYEIIYDPIQNLGRFVGNILSHIAHIVPLPYFIFRSSYLASLIWMQYTGYLFIISIITILVRGCPKIKIIVIGGWGSVLKITLRQKGGPSERCWISTGKLKIPELFVHWKRYSLPKNKKNKISKPHL